MLLSLQRVTATILACGFLSHCLMAAEPLHQRIDAVMAKAQLLPVAGEASDFKFARRVFLKLTGTIPTSSQLESFVADKSPDKRQKLLKKLLNSEAFVRHMVDVFDVMLMERRNDKHIKSPEWRAYLTDAFRKNKPFHQIASEILAADGSQAATRGAAKFYLDRDAEVNLVTRDVGRMFFGIDLQCAQCHDHPLVDSYYQADYYGLYAFLNRNYVFTAKDKKVYLAEKTDGNVAYVSVFTNDGGTIGPRLPGEPEVIEPIAFRGEDYKVAPAANVRPIPKFSRRELLGKSVMTGKNLAFNRNVTNRVWALMIGRGLVEPVDLHHDDNPVAFPEVLELLASEFPRLNYDLRALMEQVAMTQVFQRSYDVPADFDSKIDQLAGNLKRWQGEHAKLQKEFEAAASATAREIEKLEELRATAIEKRVHFNKELDVEGKAWKPYSDALKASQAVAKTIAAKQKNFDVIAPLVKSASGKALADDKEVKAIADKLQAKLNKLAAEIKKAQTDKGAKDKAAVAKKPPVDKARKAVAAANTALKAALEAKQKQFQVYKAKNKTRLAKLRASQFRKLQLAQVEKLLAMRAADHRLSQSHTELEASRGKLTQAKLAIVDMMKAKEVAQNKLKAANVKMSALMSQVRDAQNKVVAIQQKRSTLTGLQAALKDAAQKTADKELVAVAEKLKPSINRIQQSEASMTSTLTQLKADQVKLQQREKEIQAGLSKVSGEVSTLEKQIQALNAGITKTQSAIKKISEEVDSARGKADQATAEGFAVSQLSALTPEELAWAMMTATGYVERQKASTAAAINKKKPLSDADKKDPAKVAARQKEIDDAAYEKLRGNVGNFVKLFSAGAGQPQNDFFATADQALFLANGSVVLSWLSPSSGNLTDRLNKEKDPRKIATELYRSVLTRDPSEQEINELTAFIAKREKEKVKAVQDFAWALLTSAEFRFHH